MLKMLEKRLGKVEKTVDDRTNAEIEAQKREQWRETEGKLTRTPESRAALRAYCQRLFRSMRWQKRRRIEAMTSPEQLARFRIEWAKEDDESERYEQNYLKEAKVTGEELESFLSRIIGEADGDGIRKTPEKT